MKGYIESKLDDVVRQDGWSVQPTHNAHEWELSRGRLHVTFHEARVRDDRIVLLTHSDEGTVEAASVGFGCPWRIESWLKNLASLTSGDVDAE